MKNLPQTLLLNKQKLFTALLIITIISTERGVASVDSDQAIELSSYEAPISEAFPVHHSSLTSDISALRGAEQTGLTFPGSLAPPVPSDLPTLPASEPVLSPTNPLSTYPARIPMSEAKGRTDGAPLALTSFPAAPRKPAARGVREMSLMPPTLAPTYHSGAPEAPQLSVERLALPTSDETAAKPQRFNVTPRPPFGKS